MVNKDLHKSITTAGRHMWAIISTVVFDWKDLYDAERGLLAIAKFLVYSQYYINRTQHNALELIWICPWSTVISPLESLQQVQIWSCDGHLLCCQSPRAFKSHLNDSAAPKCTTNDDCAPLSTGDKCFVVCIQPVLARRGNRRTMYNERSNSSRQCTILSCSRHSLELSCRLNTSACPPPFK